MSCRQRSRPRPRTASAGQLPWADPPATPPPTLVAVRHGTAGLTSAGAPTDRRCTRVPHGRRRAPSTAGHHRGRGGRGRRPGRRNALGPGRAVGARLAARPRHHHRVAGCALVPLLLWAPVPGALLLAALAAVSPAATPPATVG